MDVESSRDLRVKLHYLARYMKSHVGNLGDEHERWRLYRLALDSPKAAPILFQCVALEHDSLVASSIVIAMLERVDPDKRELWVGQLREEDSSFVRHRVNELAKLDSLQVGGIRAEEISGQLGNWSNWLQLKAVAVTRDRAVLRIIAEHGRSKRIRRMAKEAMGGAV